MSFRTILRSLLAVLVLTLPFQDLHALELGHEAPDFELQDLSGRKVTLEGFRGRAVVLHFWSVLCAPCVVELPAIARLRDRYAANGLQVLTVSIDASQRVREFVTEHHLDLPVLLDSDKEVFFDSYAGPALPASFLIDGNGILRDRIDGATDWNAAVTRSRIERLLPPLKERK